METVTDGVVTGAEGFFLCRVEKPLSPGRAKGEGVTDTGGMGGKNVLADVIGLFCVDVTVVVAFPGADPLADLADLVCI